jgi:hypothetical protein
MEKSKEREVQCSAREKREDTSEVVSPSIPFETWLVPAGYLMQGNGAQQGTSFPEVPGNSP